MKQVLDSIKGRVIVILLVFLSLSHFVGLWLYVERSEVASALLHDALLAERIALISKLAERTPVGERASLLKLVSGPLVRFSQSPAPSLGQTLPEGSRPHLFEHLLGVFLDRDLHKGIRVAYTEENTQALTGLLSAVNASAHAEIGHLPSGPLAEIYPVGAVTTEIELGDGTWLAAAAPLLSINPFSPWKVGAALGAMLTSVLLVAGWVVQRWTQPLTYFAAAAERLGTDLHAPHMSETGPFEVRTAARAFNRMQDRIRRLVEDRMALAAAIAHDLGTPVTRLRLRAEDIDDEQIRGPILTDLQQMRRMITATLGFARLDFSVETPEVFDLMSLIERVVDDLVDGGDDIAIKGPPHLPVRSKPIALQRALFNVIENAVKYGKRASIQITEYGDTIEIAVEDNGPGIPEALQAEIFEPFRRLPNSEAVEGTGLGLTVARSLVRGLGGDIALANRAEGGLRVSISLPSRQQRASGNDICDVSVDVHKAPDTSSFGA